MDENAQTAKKPRGRPKGALNRRNVAAREKARVIAQSKLSPLEVMVKTMTERWEAAEALEPGDARAKLQTEACAVAEKVAPYLHARLQATTIKGDADQPLSFTVSLPASDALKAMIRGTTDK